MLSQKAHRAADHQLLLWPAQRCHGSVPSRCRAATIGRAANIAPELVQLERSCLADLSTEELEQQLKKHGISIQTKPRTKQQQIPPQHADTGPAAAQLDHHQLEQQQQKQHHSQQDRPKHPQHPQQQQQQQRPPHPAEASKSQQQKQQARSRSRRVAAAAARRALLLEQLANARVQARSRIVRLPLRLSIAGRAKSRRYLTVPVDVEGAGFVDFLVDSSGYLSRITPAMRDKLGISPADGVAIVTGSGSSSSGGGDRGGRGSSSRGSSSGGRAHVRLRQRVKLPKMWLGTAQLPPQQAHVTPLQLLPRQQQQLWPGSGSGAGGGNMQRVLAAAGTVGGVLGVQVLREFEVDIDFGGNSVALHPAGHVDLGLCDTRGLVEVPLRLTKTGALVVPVSLAGSPPFTGLLDLSATSSVLNWEAAALLGMHCNLDSDGEEEDEGQDIDVEDEPSSNSSSSHAGSGPDSSVRSQQQQQRQQQQRRRARQQSAIKHVGKFGSLDVMPADEMLQKPSLRRHNSSSSSSSSTGTSSSGSDGLQSQVAPLRRAPRKEPPRSNSSSSSSSLSAAGYSYTPLPGSSIVQQHQVASNAVRLVLGSSKSGADPPNSSSSTSSSGSSTSSTSSASSSIPASLALAPPNRFSVAGLKAVSHLGLSGQPVMIVGWDIWARQRAVLCLKVGKLFLSAAAS